MNKFLKLFGYFIFVCTVITLALYATILVALLVVSFVTWSLFPLYAITSMIFLRIVLIIGFLSAISNFFTDEGKETYKKFVAIFEKNDTL